MRVKVRCPGLVAPAAFYGARWAARRCGRGKRDVDRSGGVRSRWATGGATSGAESVRRDFHATEAPVAPLGRTRISETTLAKSGEADRSTRLSVGGVSKTFLDGRLDVKIGQKSADLEFMFSWYVGLFINSSFGWPTLAGDRSMPETGIYDRLFV